MLRFFFLLASCLSFNIPKNYVQYSKIKFLYRNLYNIKENNIYSLEHVVPQSIFKKKYFNYTKDMHNIILYPLKMNNHRSNYKYVDDLNFYFDSILLDKFGNKLCNYQNNLLYNDICIKTNSKKIFHPCDIYKGEIARASMYFVSTYPEFKNDVFSYVISPNDILNWHINFPVTKYEKEKNNIIFKLQGNKNIYISHPSLLNIDLYLFS